MNWFLIALNKYSTFAGRAQRSEYWYFMLFYFLIVIACTFADAFFGTYSRSADIGLLSGISSLAFLLPLIAVTARRLHDTGKSGWWQLIAVIPFIGGLILLVYMLKDSFPAGNEYGQNPKGAA